MEKLHNILRNLNMELYKNKEDCCGCSACKSICPKSAISMQPDEEGFLYPVVDGNLCINCGLCKNVCAFQNGYNTEQNFKEPLVYAVRHKDINEVLTSRSGAMFIAISDYVLQNSGVVYGVGYTDHFRVVHKRAVTKQERNEFKGSKYVQSDINETFKLIKNDLQNGLMVLFSGTPCQTAGLYSYIRNENVERLFVCDIICYGTPSPYIWRDYLHYIENKYKDSIIKVDFRDKEFGWASGKESFVLKKTDKKITKDIYNQLFGATVMLRSSCGICKYANFQRPSDITIGDYWGWEKISSSINTDNKGVSVVLINNQKGLDLFDKIKNDIIYIESEVSKCIQPRLQYPTEISSKRQLCGNDYKKYGFKFIAKKYGNLGLENAFCEKFVIFKKIIKQIKLK
jgi:coenzyme F420-reducing hydrogenase beta subunit